MSTVYDLLEKWGESVGRDPKLLAHHLQKLELEDKIIPKLYSKDLDSDGKVREILDIYSIAVSNLKGIEARNLDVKPGITMIYGPNDAGKSTFLDGLELALKGARGEAVPALMRHGTSEMEVRLRATACEIDRTFKRKIATRGKKAGEESFEHSLLVTIDGTRDNKTEKAQALVQSWLQVDLDFVVRCCMVRQGYLADVLDEEASKRQQLFFRLLALDAAEETREAIAKVAKTQAAKLGAQTAVIEPAEAQIAKLKAELAKMPIDQMKSRVFELEAATGGNTAATRVDKEARLSLMKAAVKQHEKFKALLEKYTSRIQELNKSPALFLEVVDMAPKAASAELSVRNAIASTATAEWKLETVTQQGRAIKREGKCPTCENLCGHDTKERSLARLKTAHAAINTEVEVARNARHEADALFTHMSGERIRMGAIAAEKKGIQSTVAAMVALTSELHLLMGTFDVRSASQDIAQLEKVIGAEAGDPKLIEEAADWRKHLASADAMLLQIKALEGTIASAKSGVATGYDPAVLEDLELAFSKKGMPLWIARGHVARVNAIAAEIAAGDRYRYELGPDLEVVILDGEKAISPRAASGSSRQRGALVILVSMALYLQELAQIKIPFLWVDEIPFQDKANQLLMIEILKNIGKRVPKVLFGASDWEIYEGHFDHQIGLLPPHKAIGAPVVQQPTVQLHGKPPLSTVASPAADAADRMALERPTPGAPVVKPSTTTFDQLEDKLNPLPDPKPWDGAPVDPMMQTIPATPTLDIDLDDDPF